MALGPNVGIAITMGDSAVDVMVGVTEGEEKGNNVVVGCATDTSDGVEQPLREIRAYKENTILNIFVKSARIIPEGLHRIEYFMCIFEVDSCNQQKNPL